MSQLIRVAMCAIATTTLVATVHAQTSTAAKSSPDHIRAVTGQVNGEMITANTATSKDWPSHGLDYGEKRFSTLTSIDSSNVERLGLAWSYNMGSIRGVEATPLVVDGIMYATAPWSIVHAIDARTGKALWTFDPKVDRAGGYKGCCDVVNRGVALWEGKVFVGVYDGRLIALDAATGKVEWETDTIIDRSRSYTITGAPRVVKGRVVIGNGGAEYGVRGYVTAYDAKTGDQAWRWFTVPGDPSKPFEDESMEKAAKTWDPAGKWWENGGGGTAWDSMTYDPELNLLYVGTGNGSPWAHSQRSPAGGDNLYLSSIVALNADTGQYVWHYQQTPGDNWDYTATQPIILADLAIDGKQRKVLMQAPKNGFFYVIDRTNGEFISAENFVDVNWATGYDKNGRPVEIPEARDTTKPLDAIPGPYGASNWQSMSFNPETGLAYFAVQNIPINMTVDTDWKLDESKPGAPHSGLGWNLAFFANVQPPKTLPFGRLIAWDPVAQKEVWRHEYVSPWNGGTLTTAGNLVFNGSADGRFIAFDARTGDKLWDTPVGSGVVAAPITYEMDGKQYVSIAVGWGGVYGQSVQASGRQAEGTLYTYVLDGTAKAPAFVEYKVGELLAGVEYDKTHVEEGTMLYVANCVFCHGIPGVDRGGNIKNLGYSETAVIENLDAWLFNGPSLNKGMPDFTGKLTSEEATKIKAFIQGTADAIRPAD